MKNKTPKFSVGDLVKTPKTLYDETVGIITNIDRLFKKVYPNGEFDPDGLVTEEKTIKGIQIPYEFDGETLIVHYPQWETETVIMKAYSETRKFYGYSYTVKSLKMNTLHFEKSLKLIGGKESTECKKFQEQLNKPIINKYQPTLGVTYVSLSCSWDKGFLNKENWEEQLLAPYKKCGLYETVELTEWFNNTLVLQVKLTPKGVEYFQKIEFSFIPKINKL